MMGIAKKVTRECGKFNVTYYIDRRYCARIENYIMCVWCSSFFMFHIKKGFLDARKSHTHWLPLSRWMRDKVTATTLKYAGNFKKVKKSAESGSNGQMYCVYFTKLIYHNSVCVYAFYFFSLSVRFMFVLLSLLISASSPFSCGSAFSTSSATALKCFRRQFN